VGSVGVFGIVVGLIDGGLVEDIICVQPAGLQLGQARRSALPKQFHEMINSNECTVLFSGKMFCISHP